MLFYSAYPHAGGDLIPLFRTLPKQIPACAGMSGLTLRSNSLASCPDEHREGAAAGGLGPANGREQTIMKP